MVSKDENTLEAAFEPATEEVALAVEDEAESAPRLDEPEVGDAGYHALDCQLIIATIETLQRRIDERFPGSGLAGVCGGLAELGRQADARTADIAKPIIALRVTSAMVIVVIVALTVAVFFSARLPNKSMSPTELAPVLEAVINDVVLIGAAIFFLVTTETRIRRRRTLAALHELRSVAHIIDMHQLTKDPERALHRGPSTPSSPQRRMSSFQLSRYLDYCSEMLSLTGKLAALYVQRFDDAVAVSSVNELEDLCTGLSRKIWQKIMILQSLSEEPAKGV